MAFELPSLPYNYNALEPVLDEQTMQIHHDKHHAAYVEKLNKALSEVEGKDFQDLEITELLGKLDTIPENIRTAVRNNGGGHANHSFFWEILQAPSENNKPTGELQDAIVKEFSSFEKFQEEFANAAVNRFGSGWAWVTVEDGKLVISSTPNQDNPWMEGKKPIIGLDVWEHAYYLKYQNKRVDYVAAFWQIVNWTKVTEHFKNAAR